MYEGRVEADKCLSKRLVEVWSSGGKGFLPAACPQEAKVLGAHFKRLLETKLGYPSLSSWPRGLSFYVLNTE